MKRNKVQQSIISFFKKPKAQIDAIEENLDEEHLHRYGNNDDSNRSSRVDVTSGSNNSAPNDREKDEDAILPSVIDDGQSEKFNQDSDQDIVATLWQANQFDIGKANRDSLDDITKKYILTSLLLPKLPHKFPVTAGKSGNRSFQPTWITENGFDFLAYSTSEEEVYCKKCWLFYHEGVGKGYHQYPGKLVTTSCRDWKKAIELFKKHKKKEYHEVCDTRGTLFLNVASGKQLDILSQLDIQRANGKEENRATLRPIIETVLFCGEQELPVRGDNDSGTFPLERPEKKYGTFRALLRFKIKSGDRELKKHITNSAKNATYLSPEMQNEIIQTASDIVTEKIINKVYNTDCFSILGDETMDVRALSNYQYVCGVWILQRTRPLQY
ncbi:PREDICTED: zinc finger MYM-type protein 1-like [Rhagoletis zephyria]|uniref:zinc finger MYM-type protein 1-like n=1 Tax=Rhagoletis zephyria TaxID=28612 RepID=UPI00081129D5|nr:PREDICTED: zinc finger MYM-type protein 1-like [Rhagoletis zephyria]